MHRGTACVHGSRRTSFSSLHFIVSLSLALELLAVLRSYMGHRLIERQRLGIVFADALMRAEFVLAEVVRISSGANFMHWMTSHSTIVSTSMQTPLWSLSSAPTLENRLKNRLSRRRMSEVKPTWSIGPKDSVRRSIQALLRFCRPRE